MKKINFGLMSLVLAILEMVLIAFAYSSIGFPMPLLGYLFLITAIVTYISFTTEKDYPKRRNLAKISLVLMTVIGFFGLALFGAILNSI